MDPFKMLVSQLEEIQKQSFVGFSIVCVSLTAAVIYFLKVSFFDLWGENEPLPNYEEGDDDEEIWVGKFVVGVTALILGPFILFWATDFF